MEYSEIRDRFKEYSDRRWDFWYQMKLEIAQLHVEYEASLKLADRFYRDANGKDRLYTYIAQAKDGLTAEVPTQALETGPGLALSFVVVTALEERPNALPKTEVGVALTLSKDAGKYVVEFDGKDPVVVTVTAADVPGKYAEVAEVIKRFILKSCDLAVFD
ncbi:hypothetical protein [Aquitalea aquatica]|uniref:Uncharacterized protein n=1 Tax=Aquitalea aquatica TaxID=3044273 RepID=A0A838Y528_9NEIS|nr:hypothetical protein [Aquitalea magnusonii]MBA4710550.1 hypothetical protein [Aquitalea magnusonii]